MPEALTFEQVTAGDLLKDFSYALPDGSLAAVVSSRQEENDLKVRLLLGLSAPDAGSVCVLGQELAGASEKTLIALRRRVAVLFPTGGLISNLKVWENLVLPLEYHFGYSQAEIEQRGMAALARVGYAGSLTELPWSLSLYQRRQVGLARAMLIEPELIVYNATLDGLSQGEQAAMIAAAVEFHRQSGQRSSLFMTPNQETVKDLPLDRRTPVKGSFTAHD